MKQKKNSGFTYLRNLMLILISISLLVFVITASLSSLFGHSMWSWINVLRFIIGGAIVFTVFCYAFLFKVIIGR